MTIKYPSLTEKAIGLIEDENKIVFIVEDKATKMEVKEAVEKLYAVKVDKVNIMKSIRGKKKAYVKLIGDNKAVDLATKLKIL